MQPFQQIVSPRSASTIGCAPASDRSMILRRRWPSATRPCDHTPAASGPRGAIASAIAETAATSGVRPSRRTSPAAPHTQPTLPADEDRQTSQWGLGDAFQLFAGLIYLLDRPGEPVLHRRVPVDVEQDQHATDEQRGVVDELPLEASTERHATDRCREQRDERSDRDL